MPSTVVLILAGVAVAAGAPAAAADATWTEVAKLIHSDPRAIDLFGQAVDLEGDRLVVGAHFDDAPTGGDSGSVHVFERDPGGAWVGVAKLTASDAGSNWLLGANVSVSGDTVAATASGANDHRGAAYVFERDPVSGTWVEVAKLTAPDVRTTGRQAACMSYRSRRGLGPQSDAVEEAVEARVGPNAIEHGIHAQVDHR